jgi:hypothetical protein
MAEPAVMANLTSFMMALHAVIVQLPLMTSMGKTDWSQFCREIYKFRAMFVGRWICARFAT